MMRTTLIFLLISFRLYGQNDSLPFLRDSLNIIQNSSGLDHYFKSIHAFKNNTVKEINIVHVGDSHVQAGFYSEPIRKDLQSKLGNGGRGIVFPYQAAKTNGPTDYSFSSNQVWKAKRNCIEKGELPTGLSGHTIYNNSKSAILTFKPRDKNLIGKPSEIEIYHLSNLDSNFTYQITDSLGQIIASLDSNESTATKSVFKISKPVYQWNIIPNPDQVNGKSSTILGVNLFNNSGLRMHTIGVNGAEYKHYLRSEFFNVQLKELKPDLIIVSLGTNEAYNTKDFDPIKFEAIVDSFLIVTKSNNQNASILLTSPPSIGQVTVTRNKKKRKIYQYTENKNIPIVCEILQRQAIKHGCAYWNFYEVMGGYNSINKWYGKGMTDKRRIHFSKKGYLIQGNLLKNALNFEMQQKVNQE